MKIVLFMKTFSEIPNKLFFEFLKDLPEQKREMAKKMLKPFQNYQIFHLMNMK